MTPSEKLAAALSEALVPVARLDSPMVRAGKWFVFAIVIVGVLGALHGVRSDLASRFAEVSFLVPWIASVLVAITAGYSAFFMSVPGSPRGIVALPALPLTVWLGALGSGCAVELADQGTAVLGTSWGCLKFIGLTSVPLAGVMAIMLRKAAPLAPSPTMAMGGLAAAAFASAGLELFHHLQTSTMVLIWHFGTVAVVTLIASTLGRRVLGAPAY
jgi:hypothetical protein